MGLTAGEGQQTYGKSDQRSRVIDMHISVENLKPGMMTFGFYTVVSVQNQPDDYRIKVTFVTYAGEIYTRYYAHGTLANMLQFTLV